MIFKGFRFGMMLQLAVGPMCLMVFNTSASQGFLMGLILVLSIALVDGIYIALSGAGVASVISVGKVKTAIKIFGCIVLVLFGINSISCALGYSILPDIELFSDIIGKNIFIHGFLLTASNPLTIIFWSGVFSTQAIENKLSKKQLLFFGVGCVVSTLTFLTAVAIAGSLLSIFLPDVIIVILNIAVGAVLIFFGIRLLVKK